VVDVHPVTSSAAFSEAHSFDDFYRCHLPAAMRLAFLLCGSQTLAEDVVADAFLQVYSRWSSDVVSNWSAYLRRSIINNVYNRRRRRRVEQRDLERRDSRPGFDMPQETVVDRDAMLRALAELPHHQRAAIVLRYYLDMSEADTARELGVRIGSVKASVSRGLDRLRDLLSER
jgi:RNA polymerase sigma-70 factor (sigma-E family)